MAEYSIDELARAAGTTVRNIRSYQTKGLLPPVRRDGRTNVYSGPHLARLQLIANLLERGFKLSSIGELLETFDQGKGVSDLLGLEEALTSPWTTELPSRTNLRDLHEMFGKKVAPAELRRAIELGLLRPDGEGFVVPSPRLLNVGAELVRAGIPLETLFEQIESLREDVERISRRFVQLIAEEVFDAVSDDGIPPASEQKRLAEFVTRVRPMAKTAVEVEMARALETIIREELSDRLERYARRSEG